TPKEESAQEPPAKTRKEEPARKPEKQAASIDRYGDALPPGAKARLGTVKLETGSAIARRFALSADGKTIITFSHGRRVRWWNADTGKLREQRQLPVEFPYTASLSPDGRLLAGQERGGFEETPLDVWDIRSGKRLQRLRPSHEATFSP